MRNKLNVTCVCSTVTPGYKWYQPVQGCVGKYMSHIRLRSSQGQGHLNVTFGSSPVIPGYKWYQPVQGCVGRYKLHMVKVISRSS